MGTSIKLQAFKGEETTTKQWEDFKESFYNLYDNTKDQDDWIEAPCVYTSYRYADVKIQATNFESFKGSGIELHMWFLESDPDEQEVL